MRGRAWTSSTGSGAWPAVRKTVIDYHAAAFPGDVLRFQQALTHHRAHQLHDAPDRPPRARRRPHRDRRVRLRLRQPGGPPVAVPREFSDFMSRAPARGADAQRLTVNGVSLAVEVRGDGPAVLFIHGYPIDRSIWAHQMAVLDGWRGIAPDLRGMGQSDAPDLGYSIETYAGDLAALLDALGVDEVVLCGLSMGGYVAFEFSAAGGSGCAGWCSWTPGPRRTPPRASERRDAAAATAREGRRGHRRKHGPEAAGPLHARRGAGDRRAGAGHDRGHPRGRDRRRAGRHAGPARQYADLRRPRRAARPWCSSARRTRSYRRPGRGRWRRPFPAPVSS